MYTLPVVSGVHRYQRLAIPPIHLQVRGPCFMLTLILGVEVEREGSLAPLLLLVGITVHPFILGPKP